MSGFEAISGVTRTLASVLEAGTGIVVDFDTSPADAISDSTPLIHLFLYRIEPNPFFENQGWMRTSASGAQAPPLGVNLFYLITPYGSGQSEIQLTLGEVLKVLHDAPIISPSAFHASLLGATEELRVIHRPLSFEAATELWRSFEARSYRLSVTFEVSVLLIDSDVAVTVHPMEERQISVGQLR